jgi:hypothetical protein
MAEVMLVPTSAQPRLCRPPRYADLGQKSLVSRGGGREVVGIIRGPPGRREGIGRPVAAWLGHKAQGATCDVALVWGENLRAESGYTALTRGRVRNRVFVMAESNGGEHHPPEQRDPAQYLAQRLLAAARRPAASDARGLR